MGHITMHMRPYLEMKSPSEQDHVRREAEGPIHKPRVSENNCEASPVGSQRPQLIAEKEYSRKLLLTGTRQHFNITVVGNQS